MNTDKISRQEKYRLQALEEIAQLRKTVCKIRCKGITTLLKDINCLEQDLTYIKVKSK